MKWVQSLLFSFQINQPSEELELGDYWSCFGRVDVEVGPSLGCVNFSTSMDSYIFNYMLLLLEEDYKTLFWKLWPKIQYFLKVCLTLPNVYRLYRYVIESNKQYQYQFLFVRKCKELENKLIFWSWTFFYFFSLSGITFQWEWWNGLTWAQSSKEIR